MHSNVSHFRIASIPAIATLLSVSVAPSKTLIDYFQPTPIVGSLSKTAWGADKVGARDQSNGLEDPTMANYSYWDGKIQKASDGTYHLYCSRWAQSLGHWSGWPTSVAVHATSASLLGPYTDKGVAYTDNSSKGHNVTTFRYNDGTYGMVVSQTRPASLYNATSLNGPWTLKGVIAHDYDHTKTLEPGANTMILPEKDGSFLEVGRHGYLFRSVNNNATNMKIVNYTSAYPDSTGVPGIEATQPYAEDPVMWYSGGRYHMVVNWCDSRVALHLMSNDGVTNWKNMGLAYDPRKDFIRYTDGTVNHWNKLERPGIVMGDDGHLVAFTFAGLDVDKGGDLGNDKHGSKIIVVPFDGAAFDRDFGTTADIASRNAAAAPASSQFLSQREGAWTLRYSGYPVGRVEFRLRTLDGTALLETEADLRSGDGSFGWNEIGGLRRGAYILESSTGSRILSSTMVVKP